MTKPDNTTPIPENKNVVQKKGFFNPKASGGKNFIPNQKFSYKKPIRNNHRPQG